MAAEPFDLVITDIKMPEMDGLELLRQLKEYDPALPVIVMTAYGTVESAVEAVRAGASDYLMKPVGVPQLRAAVLKALKERERTGSWRERTGRSTASGKRRGAPPEDRRSSGPPGRWKRCCGRSGWSPPPG